MTQSDRAFLEERLKQAAGPAKRWTRGLGNAVVLWAVSLLLLFLGWKVLAWLTRLVSGFNFGPNSPFAIWFVIIAAPSCAILAVISSLRWVKRWSDPRPRLLADLDGGTMVEERYRFTAAKRFQEPEHGGLIYLFLTDDNKVFGRYDHESQDLGVQDKDPLSSSFEPRTELLLIRAPNTRYVIDEAVSGDSLDAGPAYELTIAPERWPEQEEYCDIPWSELETRLSKT